MNTGNVSAGRRFRGQQLQSLRHARAAGCCDGSRRKGIFASTEAFELPSLAAAKKVVGHTVRRASVKDASCEGSLRLQTSAERLPLFHSKLCKGALPVWHSWQPEEGLAAAHLLV